jgi:hypothetical protein
LCFLSAQTPKLLALIFARSRVAPSSERTPQIQETHAPLMEVLNEALRGLAAAAGRPGGGTAAARRPHLEAALAAAEGLAGGADAADAAAIDSALRTACGLFLPPDRDLFSDVGDVPAAPADAHAAGAAGAAAALHLRLLARLAAAADSRGALGLDALAPPPPPPGFGRAGGGPLIEELPAEGGAGGAAEPLALDLLLAAALYGGDGALNRPWGAPDAALAAEELLAALAARAGDNLLAAADGAGDADGGAAAAPPEQRLLLRALPALAARLRPAVAAHEAHRRADESRLEPYAGPDAWARALAAGQLAFALRRLRARPALAAALPAALPLALAAVADPSPDVEALGLWALAHAAGALGPDDFEGRRPGAAAAAAARRAAAGCDARAWPAAAAAAAALVGAASAAGARPDAPAARALLGALLDEGARHAHAAARAAAWLDAATPLFPQLGLALVADFSRLLPLLLEWCLAAAKPVRARALRAVEALVAATWPRAPAHAAIMWRALCRAYEDEVALSGRPEEEVLAAAAAAATAVWRCGGAEFRAAAEAAAAAGGGGGAPPGAPPLLELAREGAEGWRGAPAAA